MKVMEKLDLVYLLRGECIPYTIRPKLGLKCVYIVYTFRENVYTI